MLQCIVQASQPTINVQTRPFATLRCCQGSDRARSPCLSDFLSPGSVWPLLTRLAQASLLCFFLSGRWSRAWRLDGDAAGRAELAGLDLMISVDLWLMRCVVFDRGLRSL